MQIRVIKYSWVILGRPFTRLQEPTAGISHGPKTGTLLGMGAGFYHSINRKSARGNRLKMELSRKISLSPGCSASARLGNSRYAARERARDTGMINSTRRHVKYDGTHLEADMAWDPNPSPQIPRAEAKWSSGSGGPKSGRNHTETKDCLQS